MGSTLVTQGGLEFVREHGIEGGNGWCFRKIRRVDVTALVATPRDYTICHEMRDKEDRAFRVICSIVNIFPILDQRFGAPVARVESWWRDSDSEEALGWLGT